MSDRRPFFWLDVFTEQPLEGNGLAVVLEADSVSAETMLAFAREVGLSESTFVQTADQSGADYRNRIWTVSDEIPFAGHPSLGTAVAVAIDRGMTSANFVQQTQVGLQEVEVENQDGQWYAAIRQPLAEFGQTWSAEQTAAILGLSAEQMDPHLSAQLVSTGLPALLLPVADREALASCRPDFDALHRIESRPALNTYAFVHERGSKTVHARCFAQDLAGVEDPATGSAAGPLVAYLQDCLDISSIVVRQGEDMGRPSRLDASMVDGQPRVGGNVVLLSEGVVHLPD
jgi:trans-2,3-dihydro-3-hydroxyanthranilate isomerase